MLRPWVISVPGVSGVSVPGASSADPVTFRWPRDGIVSGILALPRSGLTADAAALSLSILDEDQQAVITDGRTGALEMPFLALSGRGFRWFSLRRVVRAGDPWTFQISNAGAGALVPNLLFRVEG